MREGEGGREREKEWVRVRETERVRERKREKMERYNYDDEWYDDWLNRNGEEGDER